MEGSGRVLVVTDQVNGLQEAVSQALDQTGHELIVAEDVGEGLRLARAKGPGLVIIDVGLSDDDGIEACRRIKSDQATREVCVALWAAQGMDAETRAAALDAGADDVIPRPLSEEELALRVRVLLRLKRTQDELRQQWRQAQRQAKKLQRAQRESERRRLYLEAMLDAVPDAIVTLDTEHRVSEWNPAAERLFGYAEEEVLGRKLDPLVAGPEADVLDEARSLTERVRSGERVPPLETVRYRKDGTPVDVRLTAAPILRNGELLGVVGTYTDISERNRAREALRRSERRFRSFIEQSRDAIVVTDEDGAIVTWNPAAERVFGLKRGEVTGQPLWDVQASLAPEARTAAEGEGMRAAVIEALRTGAGPWVEERRELEIARPDGEHRIIQSSAFPIDTSEGRGLGSVCRDVTELARAQERVRFQARLLDAVGQAVIVTEPDGTIIYWNAAAEELYGWQEEEVLGREILDITPMGASREQARQILESLKAGKRWVGQFPVQRRDGTTFPAIVSDTPVTDADGNVVAVIGVTTDITEMKRMEAALRESEARFRELFERMGDGAAIYRPEEDGDGFIIQDINQAGERISQVRREDVVGKRVRDVFPGVEDFGLFDVLHEVYRTGEPRELPVSRYEDERILLWVENYVYKLPTGEVVAVYEDVSERKRLETALRSSEERYRSLFNSIRDAILVADTERNIIDCNPAFTDLFGYTLDEIEGKKTHYVYESMDEFQRLGEALKDHVGDPSFLFTVHYQKKSGEVFPGETNVFYLQDDEGVVTGFIGLIRDVTERRRMERELRRSREHYRQLVENQGEGIGIVDAEDQFIFANPAAHDIFGVPSGDLVGRNLEAFLDEENQSLVARQTEQRRAGESSTYEIDVVRPDGERRTLLVTASPRRDDDEDQFQGTFAVFRDITRRREMEQALQAYSDQLEEMVEERTQELRQAQEKLLRQQKLATLGQLAGSINHELRGPLGNIKSGAYFLDMALEDPGDDVAETVDLLAEEVDRADAIVRSLLNFVRTEEPRREAVDVNKLLDEILETADIPAGVDVVRELDDDLPTVSADPRQLRQVFGNLIRNGAEAMSEGGRLTVVTEQPSDTGSPLKGDGIAVSVRDTGEGIPAEKQEKIFEPLFSTKADGVGLGLALTQMLVDAHGGAIEVESSVGEGSTFTVWLPLGP